MKFQPHPKYQARSNAKHSIDRGLVPKVRKQWDSMTISNRTTPPATQQHQAPKRWRVLPKHEQRRAAPPVALGRKAMQATEGGELTGTAASRGPACGFNLFHLLSFVIFEIRYLFVIMQCVSIVLESTNMDLSTG